MMLDLGNHVYYLTRPIRGPLAFEEYPPGFYYGTPDEQINGPFDDIRTCVHAQDKEMEQW